MMCLLKKSEEKQLWAKQSQRENKNKSVKHNRSLTSENHFVVFNHYTHSNRQIMQHISTVRTGFWFKWGVEHWDDKPSCKFTHQMKILAVTRITAYFLYSALYVPLLDYLRSKSEIYTLNKALTNTHTGTEKIFVHGMCITA